MNRAAWWLIGLGVGTNVVLVQPLSTQLNASDYSVSGYDKNEKGDFRGALADYNQAIALNPKDSAAYYNRGLLKEMIYREPFKIFGKQHDCIENKGKHKICKMRSIDCDNWELQSNLGNPGGFNGLTTKASFKPSKAPTP
jgi:tetratricopeptide (TPR) repeat protein